MADDPFGFIGTVIDNRHRVEQMIGEGGFGVVYRGFHLSFEQPIAVKCLKLPPHFTPEAKQLFFDKFREEGKLLAQLSQNASIVRVYDFGIASSPKGGQVPYLALEWLEGHDLEEHLAVRAKQQLPPLSEGQAMGFLRPAVDAIAFAHQLKIAHRDIKPANLFLASTAVGRVLKVLDFGIAKAMQEGETATQIATKTSSGFSAFSPKYGAPEQFLSRKYGATGPWTDVYALGLLLTELVSGRAALDGDEHGEFLLCAIDEQRPTPRLRGAEVSDAFEKLCGKAVARAPKDRFQDAGEMLAALDQTLGQVAPTVQPETLIADDVWPAPGGPPRGARAMAEDAGPPGTVAAGPAGAAGPARTEEQGPAVVAKTKPEAPAGASPDAAVGTEAFIEMQGLDAAAGPSETKPAAPAGRPEPPPERTAPAVATRPASPALGETARPDTPAAHGAGTMAAAPSPPAPAAAPAPARGRALLLGLAAVAVVVIVVAVVLLQSSAPECRSSEDCRSFGHCTQQGDGCVAATDEDCAQAAICRTDGRCSAKDGACVQPSAVVADTSAPPTRPTAAAGLMVPAGRAANDVWTGKFRARRIAGDTDKSYLDAVAHCRGQGLMLCTETQWMRACGADPALGRQQSWTASWDGNRAVLRGGEGCDDRQKAKGSSQAAERGAWCCERAIGIRSSSDDDARLESYQREQLRYEKAINDQSLSELEDLWAEGGLVFDGQAMPLGRARKSQQSWWDTHPQQWTMYDVCDVSRGPVACGADGQSRCTGLVHDCITVAALGGKLSVVKQKIGRLESKDGDELRIAEIAHHAQIRPLAEP